MNGGSAQVVVGDGLALGWGKVMRLHDDDPGKLAAIDRRNDALSKMTSHIALCQTCTRDKARIVHGGDLRKH
jgi:hypothetical protein